MYLYTKIVKQSTKYWTILGTYDIHLLLKYFQYFVIVIQAFGQFSNTHWKLLLNT